MSFGFFSRLEQVGLLKSKGFIVVMIVHMEVVEYLEVGMKGTSAKAPQTPRSGRSGNFVMMRSTHSDLEEFSRDFIGALSPQLQDVDGFLVVADPAMMN